MFFRDVHGSPPVDQIVLPTDRLVVCLGQERNIFQEKKMFLTSSILEKCFLFSHFYYLSLVNVCAHTCWYMCRGQRTACRDEFLSSTSLLRPHLPFLQDIWSMRFPSYFPVSTSISLKAWPVHYHY